LWSLFNENLFIWNSRTYLRDSRCFKAVRGLKIGNHLKWKFLSGRIDEFWEISENCYFKYSLNVKLSHYRSFTSHTNPHVLHRQNCRSKCFIKILLKIPLNYFQQRMGGLGSNRGVSRGRFEGVTPTIFWNPIRFAILKDNRDKNFWIHPWGRTEIPPPYCPPRQKR